MPFYVYILQCSDGTFYTGYTGDLQQRLRQHDSGKGAKYTRSHKPQRIMYTELFGTRSAAMKREREIKKLGHEGKLKLITSQDKQADAEK